MICALNIRGSLTASDTPSKNGFHLFDEDGFRHFVSRAAGSGESSKVYGDGLDGHRSILKKVRAPTGGWDEDWNGTKGDRGL